MACGIHCPRIKLYAEIAEPGGRVRRECVEKQTVIEAGSRDAGRHTTSEIKKLAASS